MIMIYMITGGSGSGKSAYAEQIMTRLTGVKYYIATMQVYDAEGEQKVARHRALRQGKGFRTVESPKDIGNLILTQEEHTDKSALLECLSNLVANEMFTESKVRSSDEVVAKITEDIQRLTKQLNNLLIVTNNVFEDGISYDADTMSYINALGALNARIAEFADEVVEVVVGIPVVLKSVCTCVSGKEHLCL